MSLFASGAAAAAAVAAATTGTAAPLFAAAPVPHTAAPGSFLSFASAPDLGPPPATAARSGRSGLSASSARVDVDLTAESPPRSSRERHRKERRHDDKKRRRSERSRSRSRDRARSRRSRSHDREDRPKKPKKKRHSDERKEEKKDKKRRDKEAKQPKESRRKRNTANSRTPSPSDSDLSDADATGGARDHRAAAARADEAAVLAVALGHVSPTRDVHAGEHSGGDSDAEDLASSLQFRKAAAAAREAAEDQRKIMAIEQRLKDAGAQPSYFASTMPSIRPGNDANKDTFVLDNRGDFNLPLYGLPRLDPATMAGGGWWMLGSAQLGLKHSGQVRALLQQRRRGPGEPVRLDDGSSWKEQLRFSRSQRYFYDRWHLRERDRGFKRLHVSAPPPGDERKAGVFEDGSDFVALAPPAAAANAAVAATSAVAEPVSSAEGASFDDTTAALIHDYNVALRLHPRNTALWLHFVRAQELLLHPARRVRSGAALAEKQLAILQRALEANPRHEALTLALLQRVTQLWPAPQVEARFAEALEDLPASAPLWQMLIDWRSAGGSNFPQFKAESGGVRDAYAQAIVAMSFQRQKLVDQFAQSAPVPLDASAMQHRLLEHQTRLVALTRTLQGFVSGYIRFLHGAGYTERALALWQTVMEFICFAPRASSSGPDAHSRLSQAFEAFWDSDVARFGERGALGFAKWYEEMFEGGQSPSSQEQTEADPSPSIPASRIDPPTPLSGGALAISDWLRLESQLDALQWSPQRVEPPPSVRTFESVPSILFRCVLIEDLRGCVVDVVAGAGHGHAQVAQGETHALTQEFMLSNLMMLMQLPPRMLLPPGGLFLNSLAVMQSGAMEIRASPAHASSRSVHSLSPLFECIPGVAGRRIDDPLLGPLGVSAAPSLLVEDNTVPVTGAYAPLDLDQLRSTSSSPEAHLRALLAAPDRVEFVRNCMRQMVAAQPHSNVVKTCWLTFEYALCEAERDLAPASLSEPGSSTHAPTASPPLYPLSVPRSLVKSLLRADPLNLPLLNSYALLEYRAGRLDAACKVYDKTLAALEHMPEQTKLRDAPALFWSYAHVQITRAYAAPPSPDDDHDGASAAAGAAGAGGDSDDASMLIRHALHVLLCASEGRFEPFDPVQPNLRPTRLIRARKAFTAALVGPQRTTSWSVPDASVTGVTVSPAACLSACMLWMEYLGHGLEAAQRVWDGVIMSSAGTVSVSSFGLASGSDSCFVRGDVQHEWLATIYVRMLTAHRSRHSFPPRTFRARILDLLETFPANSFFLSQLSSSYTGSGATGSGQLRRYLDRVTSGIDWDVDAARRPASDILAAKAGGLQGRTVMRAGDGAEELLWRAAHEKPRAPPAPIVWLHAISAELHRPGTIHRIETLLERALQAHALSVGQGHSVQALWRLFLRVHVCKARVGEASKLLYRALHAYPASKRLWLDGIEWIRTLRDQQATAGDGSGAATTNGGGPSAVAPLSSSPKDALSDDQIRELFELAQEKEVRHRASLLPERESDSEYRPVERAWDRHVRLEREARQRSEERRQRRRDRRHRRRRRGGHSRSRSMSTSRSRSRSRSTSRSRSRSHSSDRRRRGRSMSRSPSRSASGSHSDSSRSRSRSRSRSSSEERWRRQRRRERAPLPSRHESDSGEG